MNDKYFEYNKKYEEFLITCTLNEEGNLNFPNSSISVFNIGSMLSSGCSKVEILNEYSQLTVDDLNYAFIFFKRKTSEIDSKLSIDNTIKKFRSVSKGE